jgi:hypothetical protein
MLAIADLVSVGFDYGSTGIQVAKMREQTQASSATTGWSSNTVNKFQNKPLANVTKPSNYKTSHALLDF